MRWSRSRLLAGLVASAVLAACVWVAWPPLAPSATSGSAASRRPAPTATSAGTASSSPHEPSTATVTPPAPASAPRSAADLPPGVTAAQWQALQDELQGRPDGPAELQRLASYFAYADSLSRFRDLRGRGAPVEALAPIAHQLDAGLDEHLARRELSSAEALHVKTAVLEVLVPDATQRDQALAQWRSTALPQAPTVATRDADFKKEEAEVLAAWQARPDAQRDPQALQQQLDALRRTHFPATPN